MEKYMRRQNYLIREDERREMQLAQIRNKEVERQKYFIFLTIKQAILKNIKD